MIKFTVYGQAQPAGSKRAFVIPGTNSARVVDANAKSKPWKLQVANIAAAAYQGPLLDAPLGVVFVFYVPRPQGHFKASGALSAAGLRNPFPAKRPDVLKLARAVEDGITGVIYRDDALIVQEHLYKVWGEPERCEVVIQVLSEAEGDA